ncbi:MAG: adenylate/guanylate cyclase domain-containing protein, partial [Saprospiraceae bacterium]|nr:adenylate/guanylate cyclase domain-containing protein [Saprospiraceae bacterium]
MTRSQKEISKFPYSSRRLAAILFTDIVSYTGMMQQDEEVALKKLDRFKTTLHSHVDRCGGEIIHYYGDGCLLLFNSCIGAADFALEVQKALATSAVEDKEAEHIPIRIGIHLGEVVSRRDSIYGDGVNIASRIESIGTAGSILLSQSVRDQIKNHPEFRVQPMGSFHFKHVDEPVSVYAISNEGIALPVPEEMTGKLSEPLQMAGIAVLPFVCFNSDPSLECLCDALTEEIIADLSQIEGLRVISRTSIMTLKHSRKDLRRIAKDLNVTHIMEGSLRQSGNRIRITAQLIDAIDDQHLWAEKYTGQLDDMLDLQ